MRRLLRSAAFLGLIVALICAYKWWSSGSAITQSFQRNQLLSPFDVERFIFWRGENAFREFIVENSHDSDVLFFDGHNRWAYLLKSRHEHHQDNSDLCQFGQLQGAPIGKIWRGPAAAKIREVRFHDDHVELTISLADNLGSQTSIVTWNLIETQSGSGLLQDYFSATIVEQNAARNRFYNLSDLAEKSFADEELHQAREFANELLALSKDYEDDWNYGNAIHDANVILGRIALLEDDVASAKEHLIAAGNSPGSPQLNSFGPDMKLAKELLQKNETRIVLDYFELCRNFWELDGGRLTQWSEDVVAGRMPDF